MIVGIIDVGSNTIRLSIYKTEQKKITLLLHKKTMAGLIGFVKNGEMCQKGIRRACEVLCLYQHILSNFEIDEIYAVSYTHLGCAPFPLHRELHNRNRNYYSRPVLL